MKFKTQLLLGNGLVLLLMMVIAIIGYRSIQSLFNTAQWVTHTHQAVEYGKSLIEAMIDMETGVRGFIITGHEEFLEPYQDGQESFREIMTKVQKHVSDNPSQLKRLDEIAVLEQSWRKEVAEIAISQRKMVGQVKDNPDSQTWLVAKINNNLMEVIHTKLDQLRNDKTAITDDKGELLIMAVIQDIDAQENLWQKFLLAANQPDSQKEFKELFDAGKKSIAMRLKEIESHFAGDIAKLALISELQDLLTQWENEVITPAIQTPPEINKHVITFEDIVDSIKAGQGKKQMDNIRALVAQFINTEKELLVNRDEEVTYVVTLATHGVIWGTLIAFVVGLTVVILINNRMIKQLGGEPSLVTEIVQKISAGDFSMQFESGNTGLFGSIQAMLEKLRDVVNKVIESAEIVNAATQEISSGNVNLSQRTEQQAASVEETSSSMEEMTSSVQQNADNAQTAAQLAKTAREQAQQGGQVIANAITAMEAINHSSQQIGSIVNVIDEIAFQTNLLALNAAVEAARAGDQGRGFAVVAAEVRNLAQRSATSAKEISKLIQGTTDKIQEGSQLVSQSGITLQDIITAVKKLSDIVLEIASANQEQAASIQQINQSIIQFDEITQQNAALVEEISTASDSMKDEASLLKEHISFFRVSGSTTPTTHSSQLPPINVEKSQPKPTSPKKVKPVLSSQERKNRYQELHSQEWDHF